MTFVQLAVGEGPCAVEASITLCGGDVCVAICGGTRHHIGATAISLPRPSLKVAGKTSSSTSVFCVPGHKEDDLARGAAERIAATCGVTACVSVGLHVDHAGDDDIRRLVDNYSLLVETILSELESLRRGTALLEDGVVIDRQEEIAEPF